MPVPIDAAPHLPDVLHEFFTSALLVLCLVAVASGSRARKAGGGSGVEGDRIFDPPSPGQESQ